MRTASIPVVHGLWLCALLGACSGDEETGEASSGTGAAACPAPNMVCPGGECVGMMESCPYHPEPSGMRVSETEACDKVQTAFKERALFLKCGSTVRACPQFLRVQYDPDCMQYDAGSVDGCVKYFKEAVRCSDLVEKNCVLTAYPETAPNGCP